MHEASALQNLNSCISSQYCSRIQQMTVIRMQDDDGDLMAPFNLNLTSLGHVDGELQPRACKLGLPALPTHAPHQAPRKRAPAKQQTAAKPPGAWPLSNLLLPLMQSYALRLQQQQQQHLQNLNHYMQVYGKCRIRVSCRPRWTIATACRGFHASGSPR